MVLVPLQKKQVLQSTLKAIYIRDGSGEKYHQEMTRNNNIKTQRPESRTKSVPPGLNEAINSPPKTVINQTLTKHIYRRGEPRIEQGQGSHDRAKTQE